VFSVPSKVLSYHCAGRPILGAMPAANLASRIVARQGSGVCVEPGDVDGFLAQASRLKEDAAWREKCGHAAREYAETHFDIRAIADRFEGVFERAMGIGRDRPSTGTTRTLATP